MTNYNSATKMFYTRQSDGQSYCFSPVPLLAESKEYLRVANNGAGLAIITTLTFNGILLPELPALTGVSPDATCLELLDRKSDQLSFALSEDRGSLVVVDGSGYTVINSRPSVKSLSFDESQIVNHRKYSIVFEVESDFGNDRIKDYQETWAFQQNEDDTVGATHTINAQGIYDAVFGATALTNAKTFVLSRANTLSKTQSSFIQTPYVSALVAVNNLTGFNHVRSENADIAAGTYEINETWTLASGSYKDDRTIEQSWELGSNNQLVETVTVNGTVQGYGDTTFDKYTNAVNGFDNVVAPEIGFYTGSGISSRSISKNRFGGNVSYTLVRLPDNIPDHIETRGLTRSIERNDDGSVTQTITTSAQLRAGSPSGIEALSEWVWGQNYPINFADPPFSASLSGNIETISVQRDDIAKSISLTRAFRDQSTRNYREEWEVNRQEQTDTSLVSVTVNGTVYGLGIESGTKTEVRFNYASGAYFGTVYPQLRTRVLPIIPTGYCVGSNPRSSTLGFNRQNGIITYSQTYDSSFLTSNPKIRHEEVEVTFTNSSDVVVEFPIPGKSDGPILQDQETITGLQKSLRIQYTMTPSGDVCSQTTPNSNLLLSDAITESNILILNTPSSNNRGEKPESTARVFKVEDNYNWNRQTMVFQRNVTWKYSQ
jgi:hypothetical protein